MDRWVEEVLHNSLRLRLKADRVLFDSATEQQKLIIFENAKFGDGTVDRCKYRSPDSRIVPAYHLRAAMCRCSHATQPLQPLSEFVDADE